MDGEDIRAIVIDAGSYSVRAGFAGDDAPQTIFPSVTAVGPDQESYVGDAAISKHKDLGLLYPYPLKGGDVTNWWSMEKVWNQAFTELQTSPSETPVILSEPPTKTNPNRAKTAQIMFETFKVPAILIAPDAALALYQAGVSTGVIVDSGYGSTRVVPVVDGQVVRDAVCYTGVAGDDITSCLEKELATLGISVGGDEIERAGVFREMKERCCFVASDFAELSTKAETSDEINKEYNLPDGQTVTIGAARFRAPEVLFKPDLFDLKNDGIHTAVSKSILKCDKDVQSSLYKNIVLSGGTSLLPGMPDRLHSEIAALASGSTVNVKAPPERKYAVWIGGSMAGSVVSMQNHFVSREEYEESGANIVYKKAGLSIK